MTENKLRKFLDKPRDPPTGTKTHQPILLTDSKGNHLKNFAIHAAETDILWWSKGGAKTADSAAWLKRNISWKTSNYENIWLYVWLGTCDLTSKNKQYISLTQNYSVENITQKYEEIIRTVNKNPGSRITILETPIYSIKKWNESKGHKNPDQFDEQDKILADRIFELNGKVREINKNLHTHSPEFSSDAKTSDKYRSGKDRKLKTKKYYNFKLFKDGVHPDTLLAKTWLKKIAEQTKRDCWTNTTQST